ncbi:MAG: endolytic transglycosylase MltG [Actinomycetota bacterium]
MGTGRGGMRVVRLAALGIVVVALLAAVGAALFYRQQVGGSPDGRPVKVVIDVGSTGEQIAQELLRAGVVTSDLVFRVYLKLNDAGGGLRAGEYNLREEMPYDELLASLEEGPEIEYLKLTIPEGLTEWQTAERVAEATPITAEAFLAAAKPVTVKPAALPEGVQTLEGFLYPETYFITERETAEDLVRRLVGEYDRRTADAPWDRAQALGRTPYEILVIASMVEREAQDPAEAGLVSAVIHNRLERGMQLGIDATVRYGIRKLTGPLLQSDLDKPTPYNTRLIPGLPPTPIGNPGETAIRAALEPADSNALYFVRTANCRNHVFTETYEEFLAEKAKQPASC